MLIKLFGLLATVIGLGIIALAYGVIDSITYHGMESAYATWPIYWFVGLPALGATLATHGATVVLGAR